MKGKYICFEGGDGSGKSTLAAALASELNREEKMNSPGATLIRFPSDGPVGRLIRQGLMGNVDLNNKAFLYLFAADGLQEEANIQYTLGTKGCHIVCDRHPTLSGRVFQPEHHPVEHIESVYNSAAVDGISMPDYLFVIDIPVEIAIDRMEQRTKYKDVVFEKKDPDYMNRLRQRYLELAHRFDGVILDGTDTTEQLVDQVRGIVGV